MGKTKMSAGTKSRATAEYKVKKLTPRRITMIQDFLAKTMDSPDNIGSVAWLDMLIKFLREPKRCRSTKMDILAWLKDECFKKLFDQVTCSAAKRTEPEPIFRPETMEEQSTNQAKLAPMSSGEDIDKQTLLPLPLHLIKTEMAAVKEEIDDQQGFEHADQAGNQELKEFWRPSAIEEEAEMVTVTEELLLEDEFLDEKLAHADILIMGSVKSKNQDQKEKIPTTKLGNDQCLDLGLNRSTEVFGREEMFVGDNSDQDMKPVGESKSEEFPMVAEDPFLSPTCGDENNDQPTKSQYKKDHTKHGQGATFTANDSNDVIKSINDTLISIVQDRQRKNDVSIDWDLIYLSLSIVKKVLDRME